MYIVTTNNKKNVGQKKSEILRWLQYFHFVTFQIFLPSFIIRSKFFLYFLFSFYCPFLTIFGVLPFSPGHLQLLKFFYLLLSSLTFFFISFFLLPTVFFWCFIFFTCFHPISIISQIFLPASNKHNSIFYFLYLLIKIVSC